MCVTVIERDQKSISCYGRYINLCYVMVRNHLAEESLQRVYSLDTYGHRLVGARSACGSNLLRDTVIVLLDIDESVRHKSQFLYTYNPSMHCLVCFVSHSKYRNTMNHTDPETWFHLNKEHSHDYLSLCVCVCVCMCLCARVCVCVCVDPVAECMRLPVIVVVLKTSSNESLCTCRLSVYYLPRFI